MRIKQEDFDKLSQLDRIEFRQKLDRIEDTWSGGVVFCLSRVILEVFGFILIAGIFLQGYGNYTFVQDILPTIGKVLIYSIIAAMGLDIFAAIKRHKELKKLEEDFFDFKTDTRRKR